MDKDIEYILDASILLHFLANEPNVVQRVLDLDNEKTYLTPITIAEVYYALLNKKIVSEDKLSIILNNYGTIPLNSDVAIIFAHIKESAHITGRNMDRDLWMVAFCKHVGATLLTTDRKLKDRLKHLDPPIEVIDIHK